MIIEFSYISDNYKDIQIQLLLSDNMLVSYISITRQLANEILSDTTYLFRLTFIEIPCIAFTQYTVEQLQVCMGKFQSHRNTEGDEVFQIRVIKDANCS